MPLPGGAADKYGNRYEALWTVACLAQVMDERAQAIRLEPPGQEGEGAEFWLRTRDALEYHQVKRQHSASGRWTLEDLAREGVLGHFWRRLSEPAARCVFTSAHSAFQLYELSDRARHAASFEEYERDFLKASEQRSAFEKLSRYWGAPARAVFEALKRVHAYTVSEEYLRATTESHLATLVDATPASALDTLAQLALESVHTELRACDVWHRLERRGFRRRRWESDPHVLAAVQAASDRYARSFHSPSVRGQVIPRDEAQLVLRVLERSAGKRGVLLCGEAGVGKSSVALQVVGALRQRGWPVLAFRLDTLEPRQLPEQVGADLCLPGSPVSVLAAVAQGRDCVLIIDQLDAVSLASGRNTWFFDCVDQMIRQAEGHSGLRVLLGCRRFDLDNDSRLRRLTEGEAGLDVVTVDRLSPTAVRTIVSGLGMSGEQLTGKQLELLSIPLHLSLLAEAARDPAARALDFATVKDLYDRFWRNKVRVASERLGCPVRWAEIIDALCAYMSERQVLSAPRSILDDWEADAAVLASEHVLVEDDSRYAFFHEGFFDYTFARRFVSRGHRLLPLLRGGEQHLFRRAQVRQVLLHEREADRDAYMADLSELLLGPDIRLHIKQVVLALLGGFTDPTEEEWNCVSPLIDSATDPASPLAWRRRRRGISPRPTASATNSRAWE